MINQKGLRRNPLLIVFIFFCYVQIVWADIKVSITIPTYNAASFIDRSIQSALNQTLEEIEIIVVNDASTDNTIEVLEKYNDNEKIQIVNLEENGGPSVSRNTGMKLAKGEFIGFIDGDDYIDPKYYENLYSYAKDKDVVVGIYVNSTNYSNKYLHHRKHNQHGAVVDSIWRRSFLNKHNIKFDEKLRMGEDIAFREKCYKYKPRVYETGDDGIYYYYKRREGSLMNFNPNVLKQIDSDANNEEIAKEYEKIMKKTREKGKDVTFKKNKKKVKKIIIKNKKKSGSKNHKLY